MDEPVTIDGGVAPAAGDPTRRRRGGLPAVIAAAFVPFVGSLFYYVLLAGHPVSVALYAATKLFTMVWPFAAVRAFDGGQWPIQAAPREQTARRRLRALPLGALTGVVIGGFILLAYAVTPLGPYMRDHAGDIHRKLTDLYIATPTRYMAFCAGLALVHSLVEEFFWRWYVFGRVLAAWPAGRAVAFASMAFAAHHYVILACFVSPMGAALLGTGVAIGGAIWCWMIHRQRTMLGAWLSHALVDMALFIAGYDIVFGI